MSTQFNKGQRVAVIDSPKIESFILGSIGFIFNKDTNGEFYSIHSDDIKYNVFYKITKDIIAIKDS